MLFQTSPMACDMRLPRMLRSACGMPGGTVKVMLLSWRGILVLPWRERWAGLLICVSAWVKTSANMNVINELREYRGLNTGTQSSSSRLYNASPTLFIRCESGAAVAGGSLSVLT